MDKQCTVLDCRRGASILFETADYGDIFDQLCIHHASETSMKNNSHIIVRPLHSVKIISEWDT